MAGRQCFHCKQWVEAGQAHDCWTTTEDALTRDLPEDLRDAWQRLRETAAEFGEQRVYASHNSIMFARTACYLFVRPRPTRLEVCFFLGRTVTAPQIRRADAASRAKVAHIVHVRHRDEVEAPLTEWLREAYDVSPELSGTRNAAGKTAAPAGKEAAARKVAVKKAAAAPPRKAGAAVTKKTKGTAGKAVSASRSRRRGSP